MSTPRQVVERFYRELDEGDLDAALECLAPDIDFASSPTMPWGRRVEGRRGREPVREYLTLLGETLDADVKIEEILETNGNHVVVRGVIGGQARATGSPLDVRFAHLFRVDDDKISWHRGFPDTAAVLAAMGDERMAPVSSDAKRVMVVAPWVPGRHEVIDDVKRGQLANVRLLPDVTFDFHLTQITPADWDNYHDLMLADLALMEIGLAAERDGYDAVVIETIGDGGLQELRAVLDIPVIGSGQASHLAAMALGDRFSILVVYDGFELIHRRTLRKYGWEDYCASIRWLDMKRGEPDFADMFAGREERFYPALVELAQRCIEEDGADTIVLGSTSMYKAYPYLRVHLSVPVIEPAAVAYKAAEAFLSLGLTHSRAAYRKAGTPYEDMIHGMLDGARMW